MFNLPKIEQEILKFWQEKRIFEKSLAKKSPKGDYVFYDGPPFATGTPHYGHIVASVMKDAVPRYWTMKGYHVERKWGWDCHGLPIENIVEKDFGTKNKKDIEGIGVDKFNEACRSKVLMYAKDWREVMNRLGRWADMDNGYKTMDRDYMETIWWVFKELWKKKLVYRAHKSMHICPRCETTLSQSEVAEGYRNVKDLSVVAQFELVDEPKTYVLAWTTTPWTLPGNVALAVGKDIKYVKVEKKDMEVGKLVRFVIAKEKLSDIFKDQQYKIIAEFKGADLVGKKYKPLFDYYLNKDLKNKENLYTIQSAKFVSTEEGTGIVHIAPAFGEDDMNLGRENDLPFIQHVGMDGRFKEEIRDFKGEEVKPKDDPSATDVKIIKYLAQKGLLFSKEKYEHTYPFCWRCDSPLLNYATSSWFVKVSELKPNLLKTAKKISWVPAHIKKGRFGQWLKSARDWSISRQRFWGSVMPIWVCDKCGEITVLGSVKELEKVSGKKIDDLHKHFVDKIVFPCGKCGGQMKRIPDVLDCWFESGSMPYAQLHYPFANKKKLEKNFPAQFIAEGVDQTRAWFYYLHVLANALRGKEAFSNVIVNGIVLAEDGKKMSKHLKNYPDPMNLITSRGADSLRYYLCASQVMKAEDLCFSEKDMIEQTRFLNILANVLAFYQMFAEKIKIGDLSKKDLTNVLDKWIISRLELTRKNITVKMDGYDLHAVKEIPIFIDDLSTWYLRRSRDRVKNEDKDDKAKTLKTLHYVLSRLSRLMAPFMPFMAEYLYRETGGKLESVHLESWPEARKEFADKKILAHMDTTRKLAEMALAKRSQANIKIRQPLAKLNVANCVLSSAYAALLKDEVNVREIIFKKGKGELRVQLDTKITKDLREEGLFRELVRSINEIRKQKGLTIKDRIIIEYSCLDKSIDDVVTKFRDKLMKNVFAKNIKKETANKKLAEIDANGIKIGIAIKKV